VRKVIVQQRKRPWLLNSAKLQCKGDERRLTVTRENYFRRVFFCFGSN
jgi:hypothetical protein